MRLEDYWGVGPKTSDLLADALGTEAAIEAIERGDVRALVDAGLPRGRATRILRQAHGGAAMDLLATRDARSVYKDLLGVVVEFAVTDAAADRIRILTPLESVEAMRDRQATVAEARATWAELAAADRTAVLDAFAAHGDEPGDLGAVRTARALRETGVESGAFEPVAALDGEALADAEAALAGLAGDADDVGRGADDRLDALRDQLGRVEDLAATPREVLEAVKSGAQATDELQEAFARYVADEAGVDVGRVRDVMPGEATDAADFVAETLRALRSDLREAVRQREDDVAEGLTDDLEAARPEVDAAVEAVDEVALAVSLARFATAYDLSPPTLVEDEDALAVAGAQNLFLAASDVDVQPVTYAVGDHDLATPSPPPSGDRVTVLTGANSGGKTTLLETLCVVQLLAQMGLPVPAEEAAVSPVDAVVFHRRHASFNAGVLEATLRSVVPPLTDQGRTLMLVDEFEAITEPGSAADLLHGLVTLTVDRDALGVFVTHLADDLEPLPDSARTDGIFAEGLTPDLALEVDYQPQFGTVGRSTPEFIVSRLVAQASEGEARAGYRELAEAVGEEAVQRTLSDARWQES
ncbi:MutS-related protein [Halobacteriales archaeon Cl-PHB]